MRVSASIYIAFFASLASLIGCASNNLFSETWLPPKDVPQAIKTFVVQHHNNDPAFYSMVQEEGESFIEVTLPKTTPPTEYLFSPSGELREKSVVISFSDLGIGEQSACNAAIRREFQGASISTVERVFHYQSGHDVGSIEITVKVPHRGTGQYELALSHDGTLLSIREIPLTAIDTLF